MVQSYLWKVGGILLAVAVFSNASLLPEEQAKDEEDENVPEDQWFTQYLDHFNITDNRQWKQKYQVMTDYYKDGGPAFLVMGGEWDIDGASVPISSAGIYAKKFNAMVFQLEHRYYGESHPTSDLSVANLVYLSADQALIDTAYFIKGMSEEHKLPVGTKWILFGGSYSANLAAWMRDKYGHLVYAAVADSGPLLAKVNFVDYLNVVRDIFGSCSSECVALIQEAHVKVKELLKTPEGQKIVNEKFKLCEPIDVSNKMDVYCLLGSLSDNFSGLAQSPGYYNITVQDACDMLMDTNGGDIIDRYARVNTWVEENEESECTHFRYNEKVEETKEESWDSLTALIGNRQWYYQTCTEYGYYQTSVEKENLFYEDIPLNLFVQQCKDVYGDIFNEDLIYKGKNRTNTVYGGLDCQATRVAYIYSDDDPWHALGNTETKLAESPVIYIKGGHHCAVSWELEEDDPEDVNTAWNQVQDLVGQWCSA